jgi:hypothetical protein
VFDFFKKKEPSPPPPPPQRFPPVPDWRPTIRQPLEQLVERLTFYTNGKRDFAVFENGTCVLLAAGLAGEQAEQAAKDVLHKIFHYHPDMNPTPMKDGNILVQYNHPAVNVVLDHVARENWDEIERNHQRALATSEVLITPLGHNVFDDFGKKALFGRCFMFMDAQAPRVVQVVRHVV